MKIIVATVMFILSMTTMNLFSSVGTKIERNLFKLIVDWGYLENYHPLIFSNSFNADSLFCELSEDIIRNKTTYSIENLYTKLNANLSITSNINSSLDDFLREGHEHRKYLSPGKFIDYLVINKRVTYNDSTNQFIFYTSIKNNQPYPTAPFRILGLSKIWNNYKFYYPYQEILPRNKAYEALLSKYLKVILNCKNYTEYHLAILKFTSEYRDTHSKSLSFIINNRLGKNTIPAKVRFIEHKIVVYDYFDKTILEGIGLRIGDIILEVNGESIAKIFKRNQPFIAFSNSASMYRDLSNMSLRTNQDSIRLLINRGGTCFPLNLPTYSYQDLLAREQSSKKENSLLALNDSILYIHCKYVDSSNLRNILAKNHQLKWFIFDLRSSTKWIVPIIEDFFFQAETIYASYYIPLTSRPGSFSDLKPLKVGPSKPEVKLNDPHVIVLVNEYTQSQGEFQTMVLQAIPKTKTIGSMTAGADGNTSEFLIPGNISVVMTLLGIQYPNGRKTQQSGVKIDYYSSPNLKIARLGIDQEMKLALEIIKKGG